MSEVLAIQVGNMKYIDQRDELGRSYIGYSPSMNDEEIYQASRGFWTLNPSRTFKVDRVFIVYKESIVLDLELTGIQKINNGKYYISGSSIEDSEFVGKNIQLNKSQNRINYINVDDLPTKIY